MPSIDIAGARMMARLPFNGYQAAHSASPLSFTNPMNVTAHLITYTCQTSGAKAYRVVSTQCYLTSSFFRHEEMAKKKLAGPAPKPLTTNRRNAIEAIKSSWNLQNVGDIFSECGERERRVLYQVPGETNDDFFEDATLLMMQQLAVITGDKVDVVRQRLKSRWRARTRGDADGKYEPIGLTAGSGDDGKNVSLRTDLQEFITEATAGTFAAHAKGKQTKAKTRETSESYLYRSQRSTENNRPWRTRDESR
jgi:hypothetical protein